MQKNYTSLKEFKYDNFQKFLILKEKSGEGREQIRHWAQKHGFEFHIENTMFRQKVMSVKCTHCGFEDDRKDSDCDCGCDESEFHFDCFACSEMNFVDCDTFPEDKVSWVKILEPTGFIILSKMEIQDLRKLNPTLGGQWKKISN